LKEKVAAPVYKIENTALGIRQPDHVAPANPQKLALTSPTSGGRSVGILSSLIQTTEIVLFNNTVSTPFWLEISEIHLQFYYFFFFFNSLMAITITLDSIS
jgi:hypothetical protein